NGGSARLSSFPEFSRLAGACRKLSGYCRKLLLHFEDKLVEKSWHPVHVLGLWPPCISRGRSLPGPCGSDFLSPVRFSKKAGCPLLYVRARRKSCFPAPFRRKCFFVTACFSSRSGASECSSRSPAPKT